jgi:pimeloyl-ACP methyl ester carboxylesterase
VGSVELWQQAVDRIPQGSLYVVQRAGHLPWYDDPVDVGSTVSYFLIT